MQSKISKQAILDSITTMKTPEKARRFTESVETQVLLKDFDTTKEKKLVGSVKLPHIPRDSLPICVIGDAKHIALCEKMKLSYIDEATAATFKKDKKKVKKWAKKFKVLLCSDTLIKKVPTWFGPILTKLGRYPTPISHRDDFEDKVNEVKRTQKISQKSKSVTIHGLVGNLKQDDESLRANVNTSVNQVVSLLRKGWQNIKSVNVKTTMGKPIRLQ